MSEFRTHQEMQAVYQKRHNKGENGPYVLELSNDGQKLIFFGTSHSNDPSDDQWHVLENKWHAFVSSKNPKALIYERHELDVAKDTRESALAKHSESGLAAWLAHQAGIQAESGEPSRVEEIESLKKQFSEGEIMVYYFGRQMHQWLTQDKNQNPDWDRYAENTIDRYNSLNCWDEKLNLQKVLRWLKEETGKEFDPADKQTLYAISDPSQSIVSSASGTFRDEHLFKKIKSLWKDGNDLFIVYGSGHAIVLEPALEKLVKGKVGSNE